MSDPIDETSASPAQDSAEEPGSANLSDKPEPVAEDPAPEPGGGAPAVAGPERETYGEEVPTPEDTFTSYKLINGTVDVSNAYYNEQMAIHGHASRWAESRGLRLVKARQHDGFVKITCERGGNW